jgi:lipid A disaccharide synthetase
MRNSRQRDHLRFTEPSAFHSVSAALKLRYRGARARRAVDAAHALDVPPATPYVLFGLHLQPESSIDVWAPFFSNQMWVIELLSRSIPPSHKLLVKIHKSDVSNYSTTQLERMCAYPGVELIRPFADTRRFVENAALVIAIQGTMGLEAALLGRPVIMLGESPVVGFPSVSRIGEIAGLPNLIRQKLTEPTPARGAIVEAFMSYLAPFVPASHNDWTSRVDQEALNGYARLFAALRQHVAKRSSATASVAP